VKDLSKEKRDKLSDNLLYAKFNRDVAEVRTLSKKFFGIFRYIFSFFFLLHYRIGFSIFLHFLSWAWSLQLNKLNEFISVTF